jgi:hypothetical protein
MLSVGAYWRNQSSSGHHKSHLSNCSYYIKNVWCLQNLTAGPLSGPLCQKVTRWEVFCHPVGDLSRSFYIQIIRYFFCTSRTERMRPLMHSAAHGGFEPIYLYCCFAAKVCFCSEGCQSSSPVQSRRRDSF